MKEKKILEKLIAELKAVKEKEKMTFYAIHKRSKIHETSLKNYFEEQSVPGLLNFIKLCDALDCKIVIQKK